MKTAIVILNYNDLETTKKMINSIKDYKSLDLIVIVDNKSKDNSYQELKRLENEKIKLLETDNNLGYACGNNYGLEFLKDKNVKNVIVSNPDIEVSENAVVAKVDMNMNTIITSSLISRSQETTSNDLRKEEYNVISLPSCPWTIAF